MNATHDGSGGDSRWWARGVGTWVLALVGALVGGAVAWTSANRPSTEWFVWAVFATSLTATSGAMLGYGTRRWVELRSVVDVRRRDVLPPVLTVAAVGLGGAWLAMVLTAATYGPASWRALLLMAVAAAGAAPAVCALRGVAVGTLPDGPADERLGALVRLRRMLDGTLLALSGVVALLVLAQVTAAQASGSLDPRVTILFGGGASALLVVVYVPSVLSLRRRSAALVDEVLPLADLGGEALLTRAEQRSRLESLLLVDTSVLSGLQTNLAVLSPLLASATATFLPR